MKTNLLLVLLLTTTLGCIEAAPEGRGNNGQVNNGESNNGESNNQSNNGESNNGESNNQSNNGESNNGDPNNGGPPVEWHEIDQGQRVRFDIDLPETGPVFVTSVEARGLGAEVGVDFNPTSVVFTNFAGDRIPFDYEVGSEGSFWLRLDDAKSVWMYFGSDVSVSEEGVWGPTAMYHFGVSDMGLNSGSREDLECSSTALVCDATAGIRGSAFDAGQSSLGATDLSLAAHPINAETTTLIAWLKFPQSSAEAVILDVGNGCGWELRATESDLRLNIFAPSNCEVEDTLRVDLPTIRGAYRPLVIRARRGNGSARVSLRFGPETDTQDLLLPELDGFVLGGDAANRFQGEIDELQVIPVWLNDDLIGAHVDNLGRANSVIQNELESSPPGF